MSVSGGSRYIPPQVGSHISISSAIAITRANTSPRYSDMGRRPFLVAGTRHVCHRSLTVVGVTAPAYWTFGQSAHPDASPSEHVQRQPPCQRDDEGGVS